MTLQRALKRHSWQYLINWGIKRCSGLLTASRRTLPDFIIIGSQRAGTTSLYHYLSQNPAIWPSYQKEIHYFTLHYAKGINWYRSHFPIENQKHNGNGYISGESSPYYIFHPLAYQRIAGDLPNTKFILLLRNPVDRAYSHYQYEVQKGVESLTFEKAIAAEGSRIVGEEDRLLTDDRYRSFNYQHFTYLTRGKYSIQIARWLSNISRNRLLILNSDEFYANPAQTLHKVEAFLDIAPASYTTNNKYNSTHYAKMNPELRRYLANYYYPYNQKLYDLVGCDYGWNLGWDSRGDSDWDA